MNSKTSPLGLNLKNVGHTTASWEGAPVFNSALNQFGSNLDFRISKSVLQPVPSGSSAGIAYGAGMRNAIDYLKNPRGADGTIMADNSSGNIHMIEKRM
jgi:hypothetical protein